MYHQGVRAAEWAVSSPDGNVVLTVRLADEPDHARARLEYSVTCSKAVVLEPSPLGLVRKDSAFDEGLSLESAGPIALHDSTYTVLHGKRREVRDRYNEQVLTFRNPAGSHVEVHLRAYDDGVAFRYRFPEESREPRTITSEQTGFRLPEGAKVWAHPYDDPSEYTPAYETYWQDAIPAGTPSPKAAGWAFPLLFHTPAGRWGLITEAAVDGSYCGSRLGQRPGRQPLPAAVPRPGRGQRDRRRRAVVDAPLGDSLAGHHRRHHAGADRRVDARREPQPPFDRRRHHLDQARPSLLELALRPAEPAGFHEAQGLRGPGRRDGLGIHARRRELGHHEERHGPRCHRLREVEGRGRAPLVQLRRPAQRRDRAPRGLMDQRKVRRYEFERLARWGVKGVKIDFFQSDKQNIMGLYHEILKDAADFKIMVNFHGCTLPRGWSRTYPHLMSMEAVRGEESYLFDKTYPALAPRHNATLPFTRNVVGPMDDTPDDVPGQRQPARHDRRPRDRLARRLRVGAAPLRRRPRGVPQAAGGAQGVPPEDPGGLGRDSVPAGRSREVRRDRAAGRQRLVRRRDQRTRASPARST